MKHIKKISAQRPATADLLGDIINLGKSMKGALAGMMSSSTTAK